MNKDQNLRKDAGKPRYDLISAIATEDLAKVLAEGADKYEENGWRKGMEWSRVIRSALSHLYAIQRGEDYDHESKLPHAAHLMANAMFLNEYLRLKMGKDDRFKGLKAEALNPPAPVVLLDRKPLPPAMMQPAKVAKGHKKPNRKTYRHLEYKSPHGRRPSMRDPKTGVVVPIIKDEDALLALVEPKTAFELSKHFQVAYSTGNLTIKRLQERGFKFKTKKVPRPQGVPGRGSIAYQWEG